MESFTSTSSNVENPISDLAGVFDIADDGCSICLEPFNTDNPATVTNCKHEYHLQCILNWSQRSKECPICWQLLSLKDPDSQELLSVVEIERNARARRISPNGSTYPRLPSEDFEFHNVPSLVDESDIDERVMQHLAAAALGRHHLSRRERHRFSGLARSQVVFAAPLNGSDVEQEHITPLTESSGSGNSVSAGVGGSIPTTALSPAMVEQPPVLVPISGARTSTDVAPGMTTPTSRIILQTPHNSSRRSRPSELLSFSESLKSKLSAASSRYKDSFSKSTRGFKEKFLARNNSVKEISKEVHREVTAGIAGVARMMERLDPTSKRVGGATGVEGTSKSCPCEKGVHSNCRSRNDRGNAQATSSSVPVLSSRPLSSVPGLVGVAHVQD